MSSVSLPDRNTSKHDFDQKLYRVHDDAVNLMSLNFGGKKELIEEKQEYISTAKREVSKMTFELIACIRIANALYPTCKEELHMRRVYQEKAMGICGDLLTIYELVMKELHVKDDKFTIETGNLTKEINSLKSWRTSDNKRFRDIG